MRTWRQSTVSDDEAKQNYVRVHPREGHIPGLKPGYKFDFDTNKNETDKDDNKSFEDDKEKENDVSLEDKEDKKLDKNWDGEKVPEGEWIDKELFKIGDVQVTTKDVIISSTALIIIIIGVVIACMVVSYWKRKEIAEGGRRSFTYVRRKSIDLRNSIMGQPND